MLLNKRRFFRLTRPQDQFFLMLPTICLLIAGYIVLFVSMSSIQNQCVSILIDSEVEADLMSRFLGVIQMHLLIFWSTLAALGIGGVIWALKISHWIFGPFSRLDRHLDAVLEGKESFQDLGVREADAIYPIVEKFKKVIQMQQKQ